MKKTSARITTPQPPPAPSEAPHIFTQRQWKETPAMQGELQRLLDSSVFRMACQTLLVTAMPNARPFELTPGVTADAMALADSNRYHHRSGFTQFYRGLHNLARLANTKKTGAEWGELLEEDE